MKPDAFGNCDEGWFSFCVKAPGGSLPKWNLEHPRKVNHDRGSTRRNDG